MVMEGEAVEEDAADGQGENSPASPDYLPEVTETAAGMHARVQETVQSEHDSGDETKKVDRQTEHVEAEMEDDQLVEYVAKASVREDKALEDERRLEAARSLRLVWARMDALEAEEEKAKQEVAFAAESANLFGGRSSIFGE